MVSGAPLLTSQASTRIFLFPSFPPFFRFCCRNGSMMIMLLMHLQQIKKWERGRNTFSNGVHQCLGGFLVVDARSLTQILLQIPILTLTLTLTLTLILNPNRSPYNKNKKTPRGHWRLYLRSGLNGKECKTLTDIEGAAAPVVPKFASDTANPCDSILQLGGK